MNIIDAYNILLQKQSIDDRVWMERTSIFLLACSFLFLGFVVAEVKEVRYAVAGLGTVLSVVVFFLNQAAANAILFWHAAQDKLEYEPDFDYMRSRQIIPHYHGGQCIFGKKELKMDEKGNYCLAPVPKWQFWRRVPKAGPLLSVALPGLFFLFWVFLLFSICYFPPNSG